MLKHPDRDAIFAGFEATIRETLADKGYRCLTQPEATRAGPFVTSNDYLRDARDFRDPTQKTEDLRHMNAEYGFQLFVAYAETLATSEPGQTEPERT